MHGNTLWKRSLGLLGHGCIALYVVPMIVLVVTLYMITLPIIWLGTKAAVSKLRSDGRLLEWEEAQRMLREGQGTLVFSQLEVEPVTASHYHRFAWWAHADLIAQAPSPLPHQMTMIDKDDPVVIESYAANSMYAERCNEQYLHLKSGTAKLVKVPLEWMLDEEADRQAVVTILKWNEIYEGPLIARGTPLTVEDSNHLRASCHAAAERKRKKLQKR